MKTVKNALFLLNKGITGILHSALKGFAEDDELEGGLHGDVIGKIKKDNRGVSLTEIIITMSIILTTASVAAGQYDGAIESARDAQRLANTQEITKALDLYNLENNSYPICGENNQATQECFNEIKTILEPDYISEIPNDPLNNETYEFKYYSDGADMKIEFDTEDPLDASPRVVTGRL